VPSFDPFGLKKETALETPEASDAPPSSDPQNLKTARSFLGVLLALNAAFLLVCVGGLAARVSHLAKQPRPEARPAPAPASPAGHKAETPPVPVQPKPAVEKPEPMKALPPAPKDAKAPAKAPPAAPPKEVKAPPAPLKTPPPAAPTAPVKPSATRKVEFSHSDPSAKEAHLLGAFLVRSKGRTPMTKYSTGEWRVTVTLVTGTTYSYRIETADAQGRRQTSKKQSVFVAP
jgi:outer membrane biosynthesis protein TonB